MTLNTPLAIETLLHVHYRCRPIENRQSPAVKETINRLLDHKLIQPVSQENDMVYELTALGDAFVRLLCKTESPTIAYVDAHGNLIP